MPPDSYRYWVSNNTNNLDPMSYTVNGVRVTREEYERRTGAVVYYTATFTLGAPPAPTSAITPDEILDAHDQLRGDVRLPAGW